MIVSWTQIEEGKVMRNKNRKSAIMDKEISKMQVEYVHVPDSERSEKEEENESVTETSKTKPEQEPGPSNGGTTEDIIDKLPKEVDENSAKLA
jgi:hypothetical protein